MPESLENHTASTTAMVSLASGDEAIEELKNYANSSIISTKAFDGTDVINLMIPLVPTAIAAIVKIYSINVTARRHISVTVNGIKIRGVSEKKILEVIAATSTTGVDKK